MEAALNSGVESSLIPPAAAMGLHAATLSPSAWQASSLNSVAVRGPVCA